MGYGIGRKYWPIWVSVLVLDQNQNSGFGRTLIEIDCLKNEADLLSFVSSDISFQLL
jgi:hypothetical protein